MNKKHNYFLVVLTVLLVFLIYLTIKPILSAIIGSFLLAFVFYKLHKKLLKYLKSSGISSALTVVIMLLIIIIPSVFIINSLAQESANLYHSIIRDDIPGDISNYLESNQFGSYVGTALNNAVLSISKVTSDAILGLPQFALTLIVIIILTYYLLKESDTLIEFVKTHLPFKQNKKDLLFEKFRITTGALIYGTVLTALIQGFLGGLGFYIFGISSPILWGFLMAITSVIPVFGTTIIWGPAAIFKLIQGDLVSGIGLLIYGAVIVSTLDNFIRPKLVGTKADINPALILVGAIGGIATMGFVGLFVGPLILAISVEIFSLRKELF